MCGDTPDVMPARSAASCSTCHALCRDNRPPRGSQQDVAGAYNAVFNTFKHTGSRTSLIVDPPDGRIPSLTEAAKKLQEMERSYQRAPWSVPNPGTYNLGRMNRADVNRLVIHSSVEAGFPGKPKKNFSRA